MAAFFYESPEEKSSGLFFVFMEVKLIWLISLLELIRLIGVIRIIGLSPSLTGKNIFHKFSGCFM